MDKKQKKQTITYGIVGGSLIAAILLIITIWVPNSARAGTNQAVNKVSEFYLKSWLDKEFK